MSRELDKTYDPSKYEAKLYQQWEESGAFKPNPEATKDPFTIIMPPPNANGTLHLGHMMFVLEDIMTRYRRMQGHPTLWLPGTDHAGIETQFVYERDVLGPKGQDRFSLGREQFVQDIWNYSEASKGTFLNQFKSLGFSADWSRLKFTMDDDIIKTVCTTFRQLHKDGLIYRGNRIVNWCPRCQAAFADIELDHKDREDALYTLDYGSIQIATTRPETIFADVAVAVNPEDPKYKDFIGQTATIPLIGRPIPIIADYRVLPEFGTGALKITPAHAKEDYEIGLDHKLPEISVVDLDGKMINVPEEYAGMGVDQARKATVAALEAAGALVETKPLIHAVAVHDRCGTVIEPLITEQWYVKVRPLIEPVIAKIKADEVAFVPARFKKIALDWLENEHDWNISRQIWWGIRIPVYYKTSNDPDKDAYIIGNETDARDYYGEGGYRAETDTFDTWFSSGQWPFATLQSTGDFWARQPEAAQGDAVRGNGEEQTAAYTDVRQGSTADDDAAMRPLSGFYPTSVMETGRDILTKWVTKMMMLGLYRTGQLPFHSVYLHGMVTDGQGRKMSKSKGNGIDPLEMSSKYGTDALRLALTIGITPGNDGTISERKIEGYRNFCNKLWNVSRYILSQTEAAEKTPELNSPADHWIKSKLDTTITEVTKAIEEYRFSDAGQLVYSLLWDDFADWYVEASKVAPNPSLLVYALETILKLVHPIAPFVSEAIWSEMDHNHQLITSQWPVVDTTRTPDKYKVALFGKIQNVIQAARTISAEEQLSKPTILTTDESLISSAELIRRLGRIGKLELTKQGSGLYLGITTPTWIQADINMVAARRSRLEKQQAEKQGYLKNLESKLANERYVASAPPAVVQETRDRRDETRMLLSKLDEQLEALQH